MEGDGRETGRKAESGQRKGRRMREMKTKMEREKSVGRKGRKICVIPAIDMKVNGQHVLTRAVPLATLHSTRKEYGQQN